MRTLCDRACLDEVASRLSRIQPEMKPRWGRMNAHQMVCHLGDAFRAVMGRRPVSMATEFKGRLLIKWAALYLPLPWPPNVATRPEVDAEIGGTPPLDFETDLCEAQALLLEFARKPRNFAFAPHPMFLEMTEWQWMRWGWLHTDHHLRQFGL